MISPLENRIAKRRRPSRFAGRFLAATHESCHVDAGARQSKRRPITSSRPFGQHNSFDWFTDAFGRVAISDLPP